MKFNVRDLAVSLSPQNPCQGTPPDCQGNSGDCNCTPTQEGGCTGCGCTPTLQCPCLTETVMCGSEASCDLGSCEIDSLQDDAPAEKKRSRAAHEASLGLLRQQLRSVLSQPGAC